MFPHPESVITPFGDGKILGNPFTIAAEVPVALHRPVEGQSSVIMIDYRDFVRYDDIYNIAFYFAIEPNQYYPDHPRTYCRFDYGYGIRESAIYPMGKNPEGTRYSLCTLTGHWGSWPKRPFASQFILIRSGVHRELPNAAQQPIDLAEGQSVDEWLRQYRESLSASPLGLEVHALLDQSPPGDKIIWWDLLTNNGWHRERVKNVVSLHKS